MKKELNFDGLVGPTHNFSGLSSDNRAATTYQGTLANPREAALQGLAKMELLMKLGLTQGVFPPHERPNIPTLKRLGFTGTDAEVLASAAKNAPDLLQACSSSASMWAANSATISPSSDTADCKVHITPANLASHLHRSIETATTSRVLRKIFPECIHHPPLPAGPLFGDEGAANHTRFSDGTHLFVYGARATLEAAKAIARQHQIKKPIFLQQSAEALDAGAFHNDVVAVGHENLYLYHEKAYSSPPPLPNTIKQIVIKEEILPLSDAVSSYFFNSQIVTTNDGKTVLIAPSECRNFSFIETLPFDAVHFCNLEESMHNGGGPACLRIRVILTKEELAGIHSGVILTPTLVETLKTWIKKHYRDRLVKEDLSDPSLLKESREALDELTTILQLGEIYDFQK